MPSGFALQLSSSTFCSVHMSYYFTHSSILHICSFFCLPCLSTHFLLESADPFITLNRKKGISSERHSPSHFVLNVFFSPVTSEPQYLFTLSRALRMGSCSGMTVCSAIYSTKLGTPCLKNKKLCHNQCCIFNAWHIVI